MFPEKPKRKPKRGEKRSRYIIALALVLLIGAGIFMALMVGGTSTYALTPMDYDTVKGSYETWLEKRPTDYQYDVKARIGDITRHMRLTIRDQRLVDAQHILADGSTEPVSENEIEAAQALTVNYLWGWLDSFMAALFSSNRSNVEEMKPETLARFDPHYGYPTDFVAGSCKQSDLESKCERGFTVRNFIPLDAAN